MNCREAVKHLYLEADNDSSSEERRAAKEHLFTCPECRRFFESEKEIKNLVFEKAPGRKAPLYLKECILRQIGELERPSYFVRISSLLFAPGRNKTFVSIAPLFLLLVGLVYLVIYINEDKKSHLNVDEIISQHVKYLDSRNLVDITSSNPKELESWFKDKVDFLVRAPDFDSASLLGGRLCHIFQKPVAVLVYRNQDQVLSLFVIDQPNLDISSMDMVDIDGKKLCRGYGKGVNLVLWKDRGPVYALVSGMREMELLRLASIYTRNAE
ncbi:MAG TPA: zf-HC2 domain-containing protein [Thermodesulfobacteriota bacterium]|nr:zf-HC2 domain-containing protein [Thermodesulfobacteriota bacterium]